ncbi:hypothetical protein BCR36DRAFT_582743 [Piromyces finnis]|uniref:DUF567-domain-containing protein n=1 Tax=Piromyces finnis TaxID=1754191 RepID=A0A1Y1VDW1_9FUNG|nr:hypothetical protein BCR36DRAFT_582743 [Piromyces finnis]|eukprot:ORX52243.1 hypothetical protein BCR36DRAFT_582743 [Piromyces finnis]
MKIHTYDKLSITNPNDEIVIYDKNFVFQQPVTLFLEQFLEEPRTSKYDYIITDSNNIEYFKCVKISNKKLVIYDINNVPLMNIQITFLPLQINIYGGEDDQKLIGSYLSKGSTVAEKCEFQFVNQTTQLNDSFDMNADKYYCSCGIFYGTEKKGAPMVAKFREVMDANSFMTHCNKKYIIDIAAKVDNTLIIGLAIYFAEMNFHNRKNRLNYSDLTR